MASPSDKFVVHKFGGTSVGDADCFAQVARIITSVPDRRVAVVVSAMGGKPKVTDLLIQLLELAKQNKQDQLNDTIQRLQTKHNQVMYQLLPFEIAEALSKSIRKDLKRLSQLLRAISIMRAYNENVVEFVSGHGELWSARILSEVLNQQVQQNQLGDHRFVFVDAREVLFVDTEQDEKNPSVQYEYSTQKMNEYLTKKAHELQMTDAVTHMVITGFICSNMQGVMTTLKRDGSDFTASIFGRILHAQEITIWTDVSGVLSADPRRVPESKFLDEISYQEAMELAYFGAKVIHPKTMNPAIHENIPIYIRNTFEPDHPGTKIYHRNDNAQAVPTCINCHDTKAQLAARKIVSGFSTIDDLALFNVEGSGMVGAHGTSSRLFGALDRIQVNVVLIAQASSEHSICFAVPMHHAEITKKALDETFYKEIHQGLIDKTECIAPISVIAAVGDNMRDTPGVCARFFQAMGHAGINVLAISQGSSERNISAVVRYEDSAKALRAIHSAFFLSDHTISIGIVGLNAASASFGVGKELLAQFSSQMAYLKRRFGVDLRLRAIATNNNKMLLDDSQTGIELSTIQLDQASLQEFDAGQFLAHVRLDHLPQWLIIDVSNKKHFAEELYDQWLRSNVHVISSNLNVASMPFAQYQSTLAHTFDRELFFDTEPCLPNGVPLLSSIQNSLQTGDQVTQILFTCCETLYTKAVKDAVTESSTITKEKVQQLLKQQIMERYESGCFSLDELLEQLRGVTLAKKAVLIAREMGYPAELDNVEMHSVFQDLDLPDVFPVDWNIDNLIELVQRDTKAMDTLTKSLNVTGRCPRVIAAIDGLDGTITLQVHEQLDTSHPFAMLQASQSGFACYTRRHKLHPMVVTGAIPNSSMKASSVFGSILNLARNLGARDSGGHSGRSGINKFY